MQFDKYEGRATLKWSGWHEEVAPSPARREMKDSVK